MIAIKRKKEFIWLFLLRYVSIVAFLVILGSVIYYLLFSEARKRLAGPISPPSSSKPENFLVEQQIGLKFVEFRGDRGRIEIKAERHIALKEGVYRLEGKVAIHDFGRRQGLETWISCDEAQYDQDWRLVIFSGQVRVKRQGLDFEADKVIYRREDEFLEAHGLVKFIFKKLSGEARVLTYSLREEKLNLQEGVKIKLEPEDTRQLPLNIEAQALVFDRRERRGRLEGQVHLFQGNNFGEADWAELLLSEDEQFLRYLELGGIVRGRVKGRAYDSSLNASFLRIRPFLNSNRIHALEAEGNCQLEITSANEKISFAAAKLKILFNRWGGLREIITQEQAVWNRRNLDSGHEQVARAETIIYYEERKHLLISNFQNKKAYLGEKNVSIMAAEMTLNVETQDLEAREEVQLILEPERKEEKERAGFLSSDKPLFGFAEVLYYSFGENRLILEEKARLWQEDFSIEAARIFLAFDQREIKASGEVRMIVIRRDQKKLSQARQVIIISSQMNYWPDKNQLNFEGPCEMFFADYNVRAEKMMINFKGDSSELERIESTGGVRVAKDLIVALGQSGFYEWEKDIFVLIGKPVLEDPEQGSIRGDKLTFNLAEGRILVENQGRERSISIIKK